MQRFRFRPVGFGIAAVMLLAGGGQAYAADTVTNTLRVIRVVRQADGVERKEDASTAKPGDVLEYQATYRNTGGDAARKLQATIPIPSGSVFVPSSTVPPTALASLDGITYSPIPLKRHVRQADGTVVEQVIATSEYRFIRWAPSDLPAGGTLSVSMRVSVANDSVVSTAKAVK